MKNLAWLSVILLTLFSAAAFADQAIPARNYGPPYLYPDSAKDRFYKLPWPKGVRYLTLDGYGSEPGGSHHPDYSVDWWIDSMAPLIAARAGTVTATSNTNKTCNIPGSTGNFVIVTNRDSMRDTTMPNGWRKVYVKDYYYHVHDSIPVKVGQKVAQGQLVAYVSCTGQDGTAPHLHYKTFVDSIAGVWRHLGEFDTRPGYYFISIPTPFVEITNHPNGLPEQGDYYTSQNEVSVSVENPTLSGATPQNPITVSPNPFRSRVRLDILPDVDAVYTLEVFTMDGRRVATLARERILPGLGQTCEWDASAHPAGLYLFRLSDGYTVRTVRALLAR